MKTLELRQIEIEETGLAMVADNITQAAKKKLKRVNERIQEIFGGRRAFYIREINTQADVNAKVAAYSLQLRQAHI